MCKKSIKNSQPFGKKFQKTVGGDFLTHTVGYTGDGLSVRYFNDTLSVLCEFVPQLIFLLGIFGYLIILIVYKWLAIDATDAACAPSLLIGELTL